MTLVSDVFEGLGIGSDVRFRLSGSVPYSTVYSSWNKNEGIVQDIVAPVSTTFEDAIFSARIKHELIIIQKDEVSYVAWDIQD